MRVDNSEINCLSKMGGRTMQDRNVPLPGKSEAFTVETPASAGLGLGSKSASHGQSLLCAVCCMMGTRRGEIHLISGPEIKVEM